MTVTWPGALDLSVYLVTDAAQSHAAGRDLLRTVVEAVAGGVTAVQVRMKDASARSFLDLVLRLADVLPPTVPVIVNDRVDVFLAARALGARVGGVHLGQSDLPPAAVRTLVGPDAVVGLSAGTVDELRAAEVDPAGVDYVGIGALHPTRTKPDAPPALGHKGFATLVAATRLPAVAIGGVTAADVPLLRTNGAAGAAVVSAICSAPDPRRAAELLAEAWASGA